MEPVVALSQSKRFKLGSALLFRHHEMEIGGIQALMAGNDNYMLKSLGLLKEVVEQQQQSTLAVNPSSSIRRRSASLSSTPSSGGIILSLKNGGGGVVQRSHPPTPPSSGGSSRLIPASVNGYSARLLCSCLPGCCCNCSLLSSITECQAVYHHVCARFISSAVDPAATTPCEPTPASSPPQTIPQDVVNFFCFLFFF